MRTREYLDCSVKTHEGRWFNNPLKLSEVHLVKTLARENEFVEVILAECSQETYELMFGGYV